MEFLLKRPIAVLMSFLALAIFSLLAIQQLPVSLLPEIDVPQMLVQVRYPNASASEVEQNVLEPLRLQLLTANHIKEVESTASSELGTVKLSFDFGASMDLAYIEINEQVDRLMAQLPADVPRPTVVRSSAADIPILRLQIIPNLEHPTGKELQAVALGQLASKVIRKRFEALEGVSVIDLNGLQKPAIYIQPDHRRLMGLGLSEMDLWEAIRAQNVPLGAVSVKDGHYRYFLRLDNELRTANDVCKVAIRVGGQAIALNELASVETGADIATGFHLFNGQEGLVLHIHKQADAQIGPLKERVGEVLEQLVLEFPYLDFRTTQDQTALLQASIDNLTSSLLLGALFAFAILFFFMGNWRLPLIIGISLPSSLLISFLVFQAVGLSINIISLGGLALGLGMLIDNAIIVLDNITRIWKEKMLLLAYRDLSRDLSTRKNASRQGLFEACAEGVKQVMAPLISSVLTTLAVFIPLVFMNGLAGAFFYDQAMAVAAILGASLLVAFILLPLCYWLFLRKEVALGAMEADTRVFARLLQGYEWLHHGLFRYPRVSFLAMLVVIPSLWWLWQVLAVQSLPDLPRDDFQMEVQWNEPIGIEENLKRCRNLLAEAGVEASQEAWEIGLPQFLVQSGKVQDLLGASVYLKFDTEQQRRLAEKRFSDWMPASYPNAFFQIKPAPNAFTQLFASDKAFIEARFFNRLDKTPLPADSLRRLLSGLPENSYREGEGMAEETAALVRIDLHKLQAYQADYGEVRAQLIGIFGQGAIDEIRTFGEVIPIKRAVTNQGFQEAVHNTYVDIPLLDRQQKIVNIPLSALVSLEYQKGLRSLQANASGLFQSVAFGQTEQPLALMEDVKGLVADSPRIGLAFSGAYFEAQENLEQMTYILGVAVLLLYFILAAQFESFWQPLIVLLTLPLGLSGSLLMLWLAGASINLISAIGVVVMLGIMVNDAILKIDTINRYCRLEGMALREAIDLAGKHRLKPILMTSLTTVLALCPVLFSSGLGSSLQQPLALAVIGGLSVGTVLAVFFVPLAMWVFQRRG